uniref:AMP-dependent synthetase and ligase n=1 Tax=Caulobacter sp. (strain K31) TaxID=366602 RepID=B0T3R0_CAUSK
MDEPSSAPTLLSLGDVLAYHAGRDPDRPAVTHRDVTTTRAQLEALANRRARLLAEHGVGQGDFVVIALPNCLEFFETTFALWKLGAVPCPVSPKLPEIELKAIVETVAPRLIIGPTDARLGGRPILPAGTSPGPQHGPEPLESRISPTWKAVTSGGSTGRPKVIVTRIPATTDPHKAGYAMQRFEETILSPGPLYHNAAFSAAHQCLFAGGHVVDMERFDPETALQLIERYRVGHVVFVPTMMGRIWRLPAETRERYDVSSLRVVVHLAAPCPVWLKEKWIEWLGPDRIFEVYAGTEGVGSTCISGREWLEHKGSVGRVTPGARMRILDEQGRDCAPGQIGEIFFKPSAERADGFSYIGASAKARDGWISLGDLGHVDADDYLYLADRRTDLIVSGGVNIYPAEVEAALDRHPDVRSSVVIGLPDEDLGNRVHAIVQLAPQAMGCVDETAIREFLRDQLVRYKIPRSFEFGVEELRDEAGKARRMQLRDQRIQVTAV